MATMRCHSGILVFSLVICLVSVSSAAKWNNVLRSVHHDYTKVKTIGRDVTRDVNSVLDAETKKAELVLKGVKHVKGNGCKCVGFNCGCCVHMDVPKVNLNDTGCVNMSYLPDQYGVSLTIDIDGRVIFNETISAKNPPPICVAVPYLKKEASICLRFYNLDITGIVFSGCLKLEVRFFELIVEDFNVGCFRLGKSNQSINLIESNETGMAP